MKFQEALEKLRDGFTVALKDEDRHTFIRPTDPDSTILDITITEALSDQWYTVYTEEDYKEDVGALADLLARLTASGVTLHSNGEDLREIKVSRGKGKGPNGLISNYNGKWTLK